ncbi:hypothetical protein ASD62_11715 [Phycicoccus sp. Root563]|uniref:hypothetical protein n=1 Tax=Phycicoccus sp. Root563 TaxID=1736562 RepID=UPI000703912A|nr:hypothetical protein [Phycicoccus sp. Root563]KQZ89866.1 hypothetical protein ASD62_11715 [Phycicoccus sp. Root563]
MTQVFIAQTGLDVVGATAVRRLAAAHPGERLYVLSTKPGGAEHLARTLPNVDLLMLGVDSLVNLAVHLSTVMDDVTVTIDGSSGLARKAFPLIDDRALRVFRPKSLTTPALHAEIEELDLSHIDRLEVHNALQQETALQMVPAEAQDKVILDLTWNTPEAVIAQCLDNPFGERTPVVWFGSLDATGSGFRDFARLFGHLPQDCVPVVVLQTPATPAQFDDFAASLGWSGSLPRLTVFTAPSVEFVAGLMTLVSASGGVMLSSAIDAAPNPLMAYAHDAGVALVGYANRAFDGAPWRERVATCDQGDIRGLAALVRRAVPSLVAAAS